MARINPLNPFQNALLDIDDELLTTKKIHIRIKQRTARNYITFVDGINPEHDLKKLLSCFKKTFNCTGNIEISGEGITVIKLTGDQRLKIKAYLIEKSICHPDDIIIHGT